VTSENTEFEEVLLGEKLGFGGLVPFRLPQGARRQHLYVIGKTGTGKTTLLRNLILQDIEAGRGVGLIDPHGDLAHDLLDHIPRHRTDDVVYFNPGDSEWPVGFNLLQAVAPGKRHLVASSVVGAFKAIWKDSWGPRLEYILYAAVAALLDAEGTTLLGVQRMLIDADYRRWVVKQSQDPLVKAFWLHEFESWDKKFRSEAVSALQNKVGQLLMSPPIRNILGQVKRRIDPRFMMDTGRIFIANLSKGAIGEDKANLLGAFLVTAFQQAAMARADTPENNRRDFFLSVDEFQNYSTESFAGMLSEARKYRLCLTLGHQFSEQLRPEVREAVFGNVGTTVAFRVGHMDAALLEREFGGVFSAAHFTDLDNYVACVKPLAAAGTGQPVMARMAPPGGLRHGRRNNLIEISRRKYGVGKGIVEGKINRWWRT
jgi:hypothetical protein